MTAYIKKGLRLGESLTRGGFTLIELLIVMAILGVLAVVVLIAINPAEQLARARDAGRISGVQQLGRAVSAYFTANGCMPGTAGAGACPSTAAWNADLVSSLELNAIPSLIDPAGSCTPGTGVNGWCFSDDGTNFVVYAQLESQQRKNVCGGADAYSGFSSAAARGGVWCTDEPAVGSTPAF